MAKRCDQSSPTSRSRPGQGGYALTDEDRRRAIEIRLARKADARRTREIDAANAERARHFSKTPPYGWEETHELRNELAKAKREIGRLRSQIEGKTSVRNTLLDDEIIDALGHRTLSASSIHMKVEDSYGRVSERTIARALSRLVNEGTLERVGPRNEMRYRRKP